MRSLGLADTYYYIQNKQQGPITIGNYIQYLVINYGEKEFEKEHIYTEYTYPEYMYFESLCSTLETNTTFKSTTLLFFNNWKEKLETIQTSIHWWMSK